MKLKPSPIRPHSDDNLIPMINVVFLLLVFFMVAGTLRASDPVELKPLESLQQQALTSPVSFFMSADGTVFFEGNIISLDSLPEALAIEPLAIKVDAQATVIALRTLLASLREAGVSEIELITSPTPIR